MSAFWTIHSGLPREGPGMAQDVFWAAETAGLSATASICDVACGPGGDIAAWLEAVPQGRVNALDKHGDFVAVAARNFADEPRVQVVQGDMAALGDAFGATQFDMIWCAGAAYFLGIEAALTHWRAHLAQGGHIAFSEPCFFTDTPSPGATAFWDGHPVTDAAGIDAQIAAAGFQTCAARPISDAGWEAYYTPMEARLEQLRPDAGPDMQSAIAAHEAEIAGWRAHRAETGYLLSIVRPL